jgi:hypothetical protein
MENEVANVWKGSVARDPLQKGPHCNLVVMLNVILLAAWEWIFFAVSQHGPKKEAVIVHVARWLVGVIGEGAPREVFWCTIPQRPIYDAGDLVGSTTCTKIPNCTRQSTIPHKQKYIVRLHIAMNQPAGVQGANTIGGV